MRLVYLIAGGLLVALGFKLATSGDREYGPQGATSQVELSPENFWVEGDRHKIGFHA